MDIGLKKFPEALQNSLPFVDAVAKLHSVMSKYEDKKVVISYSGGTDSDSIMWLYRTLGYNTPAIFFDTGIEYDATYKHIDYMRSEGFEIETVKARLPVPTANKKYGHPIFSKNASEMLDRLQKNGFKFKEDGWKTYEELIQLYPTSISAMRWWTNYFNSASLNVSGTKLLKEFIIENDGIGFKISNKCCYGSKKLPMKEYAKNTKLDMCIMGIRKAEGGIRSMAYKNCFIEKKDKSKTYDVYLPLFWWKIADRRLFVSEMKFKQNDVYEVYGLPRTGCAGCPFGKDFENELSAMEQYEPKLHKGIKNIFKDSYEWTRKFKEFRTEQGYVPNARKAKTEED